MNDYVKLKHFFEEPLEEDTIRRDNLKTWAKQEKNVQIIASNIINLMEESSKTSKIMIGNNNTKESDKEVMRKRVRNVFLGIPVIFSCVNPEHMELVAKRMIEICYSVFCEAEMDDTVVSAACSASLSLFQAFPEEAHDYLEKFNQTIAFHLSTMPLEALNCYPRYVKSVEFLRFVCSNHAQSLQKNVQDILILCFEIFSKLMYSNESIVLLLRTELLHLIGHILKLFLKPITLPIIKYLVPSAPLVNQENDDFEEAECNPVQFNFPTSLVLPIINYLLKQIEIHSANHHEEDKVELILAGGRDINVSLILLSRLCNLMQLVGDDSVDNCWATDIINLFSSKIETLSINTLSEAKLKCEVLSGYANILNCLPTIVVSSKCSIIYDTIIEMLLDAANSPKNIFQRFRLAVLDILSPLLYSLGSKFALKLEDFMHNVASVLKDPLILSDCVFALKSENEILEQLIPKLFENFLGSLGKKRKGTVHVRIIESIGRICCYVGFDHVNPFVNEIIDECIVTTKSHSDDVGISCVVTLSRILCSDLKHGGKFLKENKIEAIFDMLYSLINDTLFDKGSAPIQGVEPKDFNEDMAEDLTGQVQLCALEMLKSIFSCYKLVVPSPLNFNYLRYFNSLIVLLREIDKKPIVFEEDGLVHQSAVELAELIQSGISNL